MKRILLTLPAAIYELGVRTRIALYEANYLKSHGLPAPVISIGNITLGGTGKTPLVCYLARYLRDEGRSVAVLSRGYRRTVRGRVEVSDGESVLADAVAAGDEPFLIARSCPGVRVVADKDRAGAGKWLAEKSDVSVFLLDDGFQHIRLARDLNLVLMDAGDPVGGGRMVPFGRLREPLTGLKRADAVIVTRSDQAFDQAEVRDAVARYCRAGTPVFYGYHEVTGLRRLDCEGGARAIDFARRRVAMLSGIARPDRFQADLEHFAMRVVARRDFPDHYRYRMEDWNAVAADAVASGAEAIMITEKDAANLPARAVVGSPLPVYAVQIEFRCEDETALKTLVLRALMQAGAKNR
ncbi:MAG: tetraacyldisaccharide 4'-kinase [Acidobacteria bacterium]|nr:tetraacyldisaccharide 4'-kinase [Acidobacteriota bacterium]